MRHHRAFGLALESLDVVVVDDSRPMQAILRSILHGCRVARVRCFDSAEDALVAMAVEPPHLAIIDWRMKPTSGLKLVRTMRQAKAGALALVPVILVTAHPTLRLIRHAILCGIQSVIAKPFAPNTLVTRILSILADDRRFDLDETGSVFHLEGTLRLLATQKTRWNALRGLPEDDDTLVLGTPSERRRPAAEVPYRPHPVAPDPHLADPYRPADGQGAAASGSRSAFAAVRRRSDDRATGQAGAEAP
ncbi:hypothetical protein ABB55_02495 [Prosthecomicrobium hirschii]|uniref:Response regulatory domain-containing protein n=1 Tax=Prosthecodimorpha hirschii TaxID=665126 RepID=A0A0P6VGS7_9HYPH|nr:response regulator [Prosthecomicrobium hirschii]KPL51226.1 hypothetical protein ABB55_02495 [Prosthecomicrobium hirschii]